MVASLRLCIRLMQECRNNKATQESNYAPHDGNKYKLQKTGGSIQRIWTNERPFDVADFIKAKSTPMNCIASKTEESKRRAH